MRGLLTKTIAAVIAAALSLAAALLGLTSCGSEPEFRVRGEIDGLGTQNLRVTLYSGDAVQQQAAQAIDGKFQFESRADEPVAGEIYTNAGVLMARFIADRGDNLFLKFSATDPSVFEAEGNKATEELAEFMAENADAIASGDPATLNAAVERFVAKHTKSLASPLVISAYFTPEGDEKRLGEMLDRLDRRAKPMWIVEPLLQPLAASAAADTARMEPVRLLSAEGRVARLRPGGSKQLLMAFTDAGSRGADSVGALLEKLAAERAEETLRLAEISFDTDTAAWKRSVGERERPERVADYWAIGGAATPGIGRLAVERLPYFVLVDSAGAVMLRTPSVTAAAGKLGVKL
ncbi:MAG: DUF4369 domain-containing protein [Muribaculaceae bacterium]|nr:DUF4369 domain-containing protein [Muribaculaceae bacterium]